LQKSQANADQLARQLKEARINQKSLNNLKMLQNQIEYLQDRNKKLTQENEELSKTNRTFQAEM
jgi:Asp-tRNA(Asn)/Glu-tRNA(Gln) amidotransferase B subunit